MRLERSNKNDMSLQESARNGKKRKESAKEEHDLRDQNNLVASKNPFSCVYRAATQALRLVSVVPENAAKAQRKKSYSRPVYLRLLLHGWSRLHTRNRQQGAQD